jgi:hypothetical protein
VNWFGAVIVRPTADTIPAVTVFGRLNGLPIAITLSPTLTLPESANLNGCSQDEGTLTWITATSAPASEPTTVAFALCPLGKLTLIELAPLTTCSSVRMLPFVS